MRKPCMLAGMFVFMGVALLPAQQGQGPGPKGPPPLPGPLFLIGQKVVQDELNLTSEQRKKLGELWTKEMQNLKSKQPPDKKTGKTDDKTKEKGGKMEDKMKEAAKEAEKSVLEILTAEQGKRFKEITLQQQGAQALAQPELAKELGLSEEQKEIVQEAIANVRTEQFQFSQQGQKGSPDAMRKAMEKIHKTANDKIVEALTSAQKTQWEKMQGKPVKGLAPMPPPPPPPR